MSRLLIIIIVFLLQVTLLAGSSLAWNGPAHGANVPGGHSGRCAKSSRSVVRQYGWGIAGLHPCAAGGWTNGRIHIALQ